MVSQTKFDFEQSVELERVSSRISRFVVEFFELLEIGSQFHAADLKQFVADKDQSVAPGSPDRIMRDLRKRGIINYELVSRSQSLYRKVQL